MMIWLPFLKVPLPLLAGRGGVLWGLVAMLALGSEPTVQAANPERGDFPPAATSRSSAVALTNSMDVLDDSRPLTAGDKLSLRIVEDRKPPVELTVTDSGEMEVPLIGRVKAQGKTCKALAREVKGLLEKDYFYNCTVILGLDAASTRSLGKVYLTGQVKAVGPQELVPGEPLTLSRAILRAGGFAEFANRKKVKLVRKGPGGKEQSVLIDVGQILEGGGGQDLLLQPNDLIIVPERLFNF